LEEKQKREEEEQKREEAEKKIEAAEKQIKAAEKQIEAEKSSRETAEKQVEEMKDRLAKEVVIGDPLTPLTAGNTLFSFIAPNNFAKFVKDLHELALRKIPFRLNELTFYSVVGSIGSGKTRFTWEAISAVQRLLQEGLLQEGLPQDDLPHSVIICHTNLNNLLRARCSSITEKEVHYLDLAGRALAFGLSNYYYYRNFQQVMVVRISANVLEEL
jgi:hypothetical protein